MADYKREYGVPEAAAPQPSSDVPAETPRLDKVEKGGDDSQEGR